MATTIKEITALYQEVHDDLTNRYYVEHTLAKEAFDMLHDQCWVDMDKEILLASDYEAPVIQENPLAALESRIKVLEDKVWALSIRSLSGHRER